MYRFLGTPKWIGFHLLCVAAIVGMVNLGFWQLRRLDEKQAFNARIAATADQPIAPYSEVIAAATSPSLADVEYRRVEVSGVYVDRQFEIVNVSQSGTSGHDQVAGLLLDDGSILLVNRGFTGGLLTFPALPDGEVDVVGRVRRSRTASSTQTADDGNQVLTEIRRIDLAVLGTQFDQQLAPVYLEVLSEDGAAVQGLEPIAFPSLGEGPHLSYAIQWFFFSLAVVIGWVIVVRNTASGGVDGATDSTPKKRKKALIPEQYL